MDVAETIYDRDLISEYCDLLYHAQAVLNQILSIEGAIAFYQDLLFALTQLLDPIGNDIIPRILTEADNLALNRVHLIHKDVIQDDVYKIVLDFFDGDHLPQGFVATIIVLLSKRDGACRWTDFRPISLCTVFNKLITKLLNTRLNTLLSHIISPQQSGFILGRIIGDNVLLVQELFHTLDNRTRGGNTMLKLDMTKAYDCMDWSFIYSVLEAFGFDRIWIDRIRQCISECHFSVLLNGRPCGFFPSSRGLRQGDPISPSLFIIAADYFSHLLIQSSSRSLIWESPYSRGLRGASFMMTLSRRLGIRSRVGLHDFFHMGLYYFAEDSKEQARRFHWRSWKEIFLPTDEGGLGFRRLQDVVDTFCMKFSWLFRSQRSLWAQFLRDKYCTGTHLLFAIVPYSVSPIWKRLKLVGPWTEPYIDGRDHIGILISTSVAYIFEGERESDRDSRDRDILDTMFVVDTFTLSFLYSYFGAYGPQGMMLSIWEFTLLLNISFGRLSHDLLFSYGRTASCDALRGDLTLATIFGIFMDPHSPSLPILVWWHTPPIGSVKINTDEYVKDGFASTTVTVTVIVDHPQFLHVRVEDPKLARPIYLTPVYASCDVTIRKDLWEGLHHISLEMDDLDCGLDDASFQGIGILGPTVESERDWIGVVVAETIYDRDLISEYRDLLYHAQAVLNQILSIEGGFLEAKGQFTLAIAFYQDLLFALTQLLDPIRNDIIPRLLTEDDNLALNRVHLIHEVREVVFSIDADSAAGSDGLSSIFFQHCWDVIQDNVYKTVLDFFDGDHLPQGFVATIIVLLLKRDGACRWTDFRHISLCTVFNKLITKLLNTRLNTLLSRIISPQQSGFILGRIIGENVLLVQELLHTLDNRTRGDNTMLKLDMTKGDPISPSLFIIAADYFSCLLTQRFQDYPSMCYRYRGNTLVSHLSFADDMIIFANDQKQSIKRILGYWSIMRGSLQQPFTYLFKGAKRSFIYDDFIQKVRNQDLRLGFTTSFIWGSYYFAERSIWAHFLWDKHCNGTHPLFVVVHYLAFPIWKRLKLVGPRTKPYIAWYLGVGQIFFWHDSWMGETTLSSLFPHRQHTSARMPQIELSGEIHQMVPSLLSSHGSSYVQGTSIKIHTDYYEAPFCLSMSHSSTGDYGLSHDLLFSYGRTASCDALRGDLTLATIFGIFMDPHSPSLPILIWWRTPPIGSVKINNDEYVKDGFASEANVIKDHAGHCIKAFSASHRPCLNSPLH
ncbi:unnamed protein product [Fraxinus pennsylvanica]|uniref:Reverse transcriptase domain-containing protein n=1 Tax=Fraxinus pennsylvanica TaxID=56036 RepID=A0AAD1ZDA6_9LAMI|nr:unnamed protein product [Fraxinus pennsylvanica]